jgi:excisionase family DNA binding protein
MTQQIKTQNGGRMSSPHKRYYRVDEVADYFSISARTVYRLLDDGDLKASRIRGCLRVSAEEIKRFEKNVEDHDL